MSLLTPTGKELMKWTESNAAVRKFFSPLKLACVLLVGFAIIGFIIGLKIWSGTITHFSWTMLLPIPIIIVGFGIGWFSSGATVWLYDHSIVRSTGKYSAASEYTEIERGDVHAENYRGKKLFIIKFVLKDSGKFRVGPAVDTIIIPDEANVQKVIKIFRDKGVQITETP